MKAASLISAALASNDVYQAVAVYEIAGADERRALRKIILGKRSQILALARWEHTPAAVLKVLAGIEDDGVRLRVKKNHRTSGATLTKLYKSESSLSLLRLIAQHRNTPVQVLEELAEYSDDEAILKAISLNPNSSSRALRCLSRRSIESCYAGIAGHAATTGDLLSVLYTVGNEYLRAAILSHPHCPLRVLSQAMKNGSVLMLRHLAGNHRISEAMLVRLSEHSDSTVRRAAISNPLFSQSRLAAFVQDSSVLVRRALAMRDDIPAELMLRLAKDEDHWVRQRAARHSSMLPALLASLARDIDPDVRRAVARNPACPDELLELLVKDANPWVRAAVAYQPSTSVRLLKLLALDRDVDVLSGVAANPNTPQMLLLSLTQHKEADIRRGVILNPRASMRTLRELLDDPYYLHRVLLANHPVIEDDDKWHLLDDPDPAVRFTTMRWFVNKASVHSNKAKSRPAVRQVFNDSNDRRKAS